MYKELKFFFKKIGYIPCINLILVIIFTTIFELITLGSIFPLVKVIFSPEWILGVNFPDFIKNKIILIDQPKLMTVFLILFLLIYSLRTLFLLFAVWFNNNFAYKINIKFGRELIKKYLSQPYIFHTSRNSSELIRNIHDEIGRLVKISLFPVIYLVSEFLLLSAVLGLLLYIDYKSVLFFLFVFIIFGSIWFLIFGNKLKMWGNKRRQHTMFRYKYLLQALAGIKEITLLNKFNFFTNKYNDENINVSKINRNYTILSSYPKILIEFIFLTLIIFFINYNFISNTNLSSVIANVTIFFAAAFRLMPSVNKVYQNIQFLKFGKSTIKQLYIDFNLKTPSYANEKNNELSDIKKNINFKNIIISKLEFKYQGMKDYVLKDIDLKIDKGECIGIMGLSGSGKTTFLDLILGLIEPTNGKILIDGVDIQKIKREWQQMIGHIPQDIYLLDDSIKSNIALGEEENKIDNEKIFEVVNQSQLKDFIEKLPQKVNTIVGERGSSISGGEKQRIGIARSLYKERQIFVFDEATSALDKETEKNLLNEIKNYKQNKTILLISHNPEVFNICDKVYKLENKKLIKV